MKLLKQILSAAAASALMITAASPAITSAAVVSPPDTGALTAENVTARYCPDWVPDNYLEALEFSNKYGATYVKGEYICVVQQRPLHNDDLFYDIVCSGKCVENKELSYAFSKDMEFSPADAPSEEDAEAYEAYMARLRAAGISEDAQELDNYFRVEVYTTLFQDLDVTLRSGHYEDGVLSIDDSQTYTFGYNQSLLNKVQRDVFRFLPDSVEEYDAFIKEHGNICAFNNYVIFCGDVNRAAGEKYFMEQHGVGKVKTFMTYNVEERSPVMFGEPVDGLRTERTVAVYEPLTDGEVYIDFAVSRGMTPKAEDIDTRCFTLKRDYNNNLCLVENRKDLPEWVPTDLKSALVFDNKYGATHVEDGYICCVRRMVNNGKGCSERPYTRFIGSDQFDVNDYYDSRVYSRVFTFPEAVRNDEEGYDEYIAAIKNLGLSERDLEYAKTDVRYSVDVFKPLPSSRVDVYWNKFRGNYDVSHPEDCALSFICDEEGNITETDLFGWVPDCITEAQEFIKTNGNISVHDEFVIFCSVGLNFRIDPTQEGMTSIKQMYQYYLESANVIDVLGGVYGQVTVFGAKRPGTVTVDFHYSGGTDVYEPKDEAVCSFRFDNDLKASIISSEECDPLIPGDCNYDGVLGISDVVALQQWLLGTGEMIKEENADINGDGVIDVFDLVRLKKEVIKASEHSSGIVEDPKPMLAVVYENHAWGVHQDITVYDENGTGYYMYLGDPVKETDNNVYDEIVRLYDEDNTDWYDALVGIMNNGNAEKKRLADSIVGRTRKMSSELYKHKDDKLAPYIPKMCDAGQETVYLIGKDTDGKPLLLEIYSDGDCLEWIDCEEIQDYLKEICYSLGAVNINFIHELESMK